MSLKEVNLNIFMIVPLLLLLVFAVNSSLSKKKVCKLANTQPKKYIPPVIKPIGSDFKWEQTRPRPIRPFANKKNFNVSMGISDLTKAPEDWLLIEDSYLEQTKLRKRYTSEYPKNTLLAYDNEITKLAIREFYEKVTKFLLTRYPQYFKVKKHTILNLINGEEMPLNPTAVEPKQLLICLASNIEEDFLILIKDNPNDKDEEYILRATVTGFPAGFDPSFNHNKPISFIHEPVPQYRSRLKVSMSRFFNRLEPKDLWARHNWSIQTHKSRFSLGDNHAYKGDSIKPLKFEEIDFNDGCFLRVERQIFTRLPVSRANVMTVRTYLTPIKQIKDEMLADELCRAIDQLPDDLAFYKKRDAWGNAVKQYLQM